MKFISRYPFCLSDSRIGTATAHHVYKVGKEIFYLIFIMDTTVRRISARFNKKCVNLIYFAYIQHIEKPAKSFLEVISYRRKTVEVSQLLQHNN